MYKKFVGANCVLSILALAVCFSLAACSVAAPDIKKLDQEETYPDTPAALETVYSTMDELESAAGFIAQVDVQSSEVILLDGFPRTHSQAKVTTALKGGLKAGEVIEVVEEGGATDNGEAVAGVPVMNAGSTYFLFLNREDGVYFIVGAFQGKFIEKEGYVFQQATEETKMQAYSPLEIEKFQESILSAGDNAAS